MRRIQRQTEARETKGSTFIPYCLENIVHQYGNNKSSLEENEMGTAMRRRGRGSKNYTSNPKLLSLFLINRRISEP
jgi:hypothetical protein